MNQWNINDDDDDDVVVVDITIIKVGLCRTPLFGEGGVVEKTVVQFKST